jgi:hypothetical protein
MVGVGPASWVQAVDSDDINLGIIPAPEGSVFFGNKLT